MENTKEFFDVVSLSREDFNEVGYDGSNLTDAQMEKIASKVSDAMMEEFWSNIRYWAETFNLPKADNE
jgi:hypothetical protein